MRYEEEHDPIDPRLLSPEYWGEHSFTDECVDDFDEKFKARSTMALLRETFAAVWVIGQVEDKVILDLRDKHPDRTFAQEEVFSVENFHEGTIIGFNQETLYKKGNNEPVYKDGYMWGVVFGYQDKGERKKALAIANLTTAVNGMPNLKFDTIEEQPLISGDVVHRIRNQGKKDQNTALIRFNNIGVYEQGEPRGRRKRLRFPVPKPVIVFRPGINPI